MKYGKKITPLITFNVRVRPEIKKAIYKLAEEKNILPPDYVRRLFSKWVNFQMKKRKLKENVENVDKG